MKVQTLYGALFILQLLFASSVFALAYQYEMTIGSEGSGEGQFKYVEDFAFDMGGNLLVTDAATAYVQAFNKTTGTFIFRFGGKGDEDYHLEKPEGISVAPGGNIYIADYTTGYVKIYEPGGKWIKTFSNYGSEPGANIKSEFTDIHDGLYYMPEAGNHRVSVWDLKGNFKFLFGRPGSAEGELNNPEAAKFNRQQELFVTDLKNNRIQVFTRDGKFMRSFGGAGDGPGQLRAPAGLSFDKNDNVFVTEIGNNRIQVFDKHGKHITMWGKKGSGKGEFGNLHGLIVDRDTGWVYVADTANHRIQVFRPADGNRR